MQNNCSIVLVDILFYPPLNIVYIYSFKKLRDLKCNDFIFNWHSGDYLSVTSYLGFINWFTLLGCNSNINDYFLDTFSTFISIMQ